MTLKENHQKVAIVQSNYIPWKGYFDLINSVDTFVLYDTVQYTKRDWRNRNKIKTPHGLLWLSIPVEVKGKYDQKISETRIADLEWAGQHWKTISQFYSKAPCFKQYREVFEDLYLNCSETILSAVNLRFIAAINGLLGINTKIRWSSEFDLPEEKSERLLAICKQLNAGEYLSGPSAKGYLNEELFLQENIKVAWMEYAGYPEYTQLYPPFEHTVSIVDLILNMGPDAATYMRSFASEQEQGRGQ